MQSAQMISVISIHQHDTCYLLLTTYYYYYYY